jgi:hypothetical protein
MYRDWIGGFMRGEIGIVECGIVKEGVDRGCEGLCRG